MQSHESGVEFPLAFLFSFIFFFCHFDHLSLFGYLAQSSSAAERICTGKREPLTPSSGPSCSPPPTRPGSSKSLDVSVFLPQNRDLVFKEDGVEPHLRVDQRHVAKPAGKRIHAALSLGKVVRVSPAGSPRGLGKGRERGKTMRQVPGEMDTRP